MSLKRKTSKTSYTNNHGNIRPLANSHEKRQAVSGLNMQYKAQGFLFSFAAGCEALDLQERSFFAFYVPFEGFFLLKHQPFFSGNTANISKTLLGDEYCGHRCLSPHFSSGPFIGFLAEHHLGRWQALDLRWEIWKSCSIFERDMRYCKNMYFLQTHLLCYQNLTIFLNTTSLSVQQTKRRQHLFIDWLTGP